MFSEVNQTLHGVDACPDAAVFVGQVNVGQHQALAGATSSHSATVNVANVAFASRL